MGLGLYSLPPTAHLPLQLTVQGGEGVIRGIEAEHWHTDTVQPACGAGRLVVLAAGAVAKGLGRVALVELPDGACLQG